MAPPVQLTASLHPKPWLVGSDESFPFGIPAYFQEFFAVSFWGSVLYQKRKCYKNPSLNSVKRKLPQMFLFDVFPWGFGNRFPKNRGEKLRANRVTSPIVEPWHCCSAVPYTPQWHRLLKRSMMPICGWNDRPSSGPYASNRKGCLFTEGPASTNLRREVLMEKLQRSPPAMNIS